MKKVLIFSLAYFPKHVGGAEVAIKEITDRIPDIEFHLIANRFDSTLPKEEKIGNVTVHRIGITTKNPTMADLRKWPLHLNKMLYQFLAAGEAVRLNRKHHFDGTWAMMAHSTGIPAGLFKTFCPDVKYLLTLQEGDPPEYIEKLAKPVWPLFVRGFTKADALQCISTFLLGWGRRMGFKGHAEVIPNAVNAAHFAHAYSNAEIVAMQEKIGKKSGEVFVVTTSRLVHKNAVDDMIRALPLLPENVHFQIYGVGPDEEKLRALAKELNVESRTHFAGQIGHAEMPLALKSCDIFIRTSRSEGFGNSFIEAMASELPVIATHEGGIPDFLFDAKRNPDRETTGWAVDKDSPDQIADAVKDILANPAQVTKVKATAKALAFEKYDWNLIAKNMNTLLDRMLGNGTIRK